MNDTAITDTDRLDFLASTIARAYGTEPGNFRDHLDMQIRLRRSAAQAPVWIDLTVEFPIDDTPVCVRASDDREGVACYNSEAGDFYMHYPGAEIHGRLWSEVFGPKSEITQWHPAKA